MAASRGALSPAGAPAGKRGRFALCILLPLWSLILLNAAEAASIRIVVETPAGLPQRVFLSRPPGLEPSRPVLFVLHGADREARECRDAWREAALKHRFLVVVPEFSERHFRGSEAYPLGNVYDAAGQIRPRMAWSFAVLEPVFDDVRRRYGMTARGYGLFGQGDGAEFLHRFLFHVPNARVTRAVAANAGWYTMPDFEHRFPYGLRDSAVRPHDLALALQLPLTVLLAESGGRPGGLELGYSAEALAQGPHRLTRGRLFFDTAADTARSLSAPFGWQMTVVPSRADDCGPLEPATLRWLLGPPPEPPAETPPTSLPRTGP